jgi:quercetin dioxygenase-like cupin family protein
MKITRRREALSDLTPLDRDHFTGPAQSRELMPRSPDGLSAFAAVVRFDAGVRNNWHAHAGGQLLHVIDGEGWVQARGQQPLRIQAGDSIATAPNEEHWHGAGPSAPMAHISIALGETRWMERSPEPADQHRLR